MNEKVKQTLESIVQRFKEGEIPEAIAFSIFPIPNIPASRWSLLNRTLMFFAGTNDARGFRQWQQVGRHDKKGSKAFTILAPRFIRKETENEEDPKIKLVGFLGVPVSSIWRYYHAFRTFSTGSTIEISGGYKPSAGVLGQQSSVQKDSSGTTKGTSPFASS